MSASAEDTRVVQALKEASKWAASQELHQVSEKINVLPTLYARIPTCIFMRQKYYSSNTAQC